MNVMERRKELWGYAFLMPWLLLFSVFYSYPFVYGIIVSFTNFSLGKMQWIGIDNFKAILSDYAFWKSLRATFLYCLIIIPFRVMIPLLVAYALRSHGKSFGNAIKLLVYLPGVTCTVALVLAWNVLLFPNTGIVNQFLSVFGFGRFSLFDQAYTAIPTLSVLVVLCSIGNNLIIFCAALNNIPKDYYESAELDGASRMVQLFRITIPLLNSTIVYTIISTTIATLQIFEIPQLLTGGGPNYSTSSLLMLVYSSAFTRNMFGYASALGVVLFAVNAVVAVVQFRVTQKETVEY